MITSKIKVATALLVAASLLAAGVALTQQVTAGDPPPKSTPATAAKPPTADAKPPAADNPDSSTFSGRVLGPDGKPVAGATVYLSHAGGYWRRPSPATISVTSGADGRFEITVSHAKFEERWGGMVVADAPKFGVGWVDLEPGDRRDNLTVRLVKDDLPITGQIVDLEGRPIPKATLTVWQIHASAGDDVGPWAAAAQGKQGLVLDLEKKYFPRYITALCPQATTDAEGKLRLDGIGRNRLVRGILEGPTITSQHVSIVTRPGKPIDVLSHKGNQEYGEPSQTTTYYGSDFRLVAAPCNLIVGVVRDAETKKPIAGAKVQGHNQLIAPSMYRGLSPVVSTTTDPEGRYRLVGMPTGKGYTIAVIPSKDQPYVFRHVEVPPGVGVEPVTVDVDLKRGVWIEGKITDKVTGKPIKAGVEYFSRYDNPSRVEYPGFDGTIVRDDAAVTAKEDGTFRVVGLPGPGMLCVFNHMHRTYLRADQRKDEFGIKEQFVEAAPYHISFSTNYNAIARVNPAKGAESVKCDVTIDSGWTFKASVLGPDGKPLAGARAFNMNTDWKWSEALMAAEFAGGFHPQKGYDIVVLHPEKGLVATAKPPKQSGGAVVLKLQPGATATGRLVGADGKPRAGVELVLRFQTKDWPAWRDYFPRYLQTDADGRFHIEALVPDYQYRLKDATGEAVFGDGLRSGEVKDLGDVRLKRTADE
jgi:protocatechuate 3,4-dioxygenase beta subunit